MAEEIFFKLTVLKRKFDTKLPCFAWENFFVYNFKMTKSYLMCTVGLMFGPIFSKHSSTEHFEKSKQLL
jgi:hypothetical protein